MASIARVAPNLVLPFFVCLFSYLSSAGACLEGGFYDEAQQRHIREFIIYSYRPLSLDISRGNGAYLDALCELLRANCGVNLSQILPILEGLLAQHERIADFAIAVSNIELPASTCGN